MKKRNYEMKEELKEKKLNQMMMKIQQVYHKRKKNQMLIIMVLDYLVEPEQNKQQEWLLVKKHLMVSILIQQPINYHNLLNSPQEPIPTLN